MEALEKVLERDNAIHRSFGPYRKHSLRFILFALASQVRRIVCCFRMYYNPLRTRLQPRVHSAFGIANHKMNLGLKLRSQYGKHTGVIPARTLGKFIVGDIQMNPFFVYGKKALRNPYALLHASRVFAIYGRYCFHFCFLPSSILETFFRRLTCFSSFENTVLSHVAIICLASSSPV